MIRAMSRTHKAAGVSLVFQTGVQGVYVRNRLKSFVEQEKNESICVELAFVVCMFMSPSRPFGCRQSHASKFNFPAFDNVLAFYHLTATTDPADYL